MLRKSIKFKFTEECEQAFNTLKKELISSPVLQLYNPHLETQLHTDASALAIAGILLQRQKVGNGVQWLSLVKVQIRLK